MASSRKKAKIFPLGDDLAVNLDEMRLDDFRLWSESALKSFLSLRKRSTQGNVEELAARAFIAWEDQAAVDPEEDHAHRKNLDDYKSRLQVGTDVLPDPFTLKEGWVNEEGCCQWPKLYFSDISAYLSMTSPAELCNRLCNEYKQGKAYRYFSSGLLKEVYYHTVSNSCDYAFMAAKVTPSMRRSGPCYEAWVCIQKDKADIPGGKVMSAYCTCTAGLKGSCNHVAAILFRVEYAVRTGVTKPSCTSKKSEWNVPSAAVPSNPITLCDKAWHKDQYLNQGDKEHSRSVRHLAMEFSPMSKTQEEFVSRDIKAELADLVRIHAAKSCFIELHDKHTCIRKEAMKCPPTPKQVALSLGHPVSVEALAEALTLSPEDRDTLQVSTVGQSDNNIWFEQRIGRITASNFHRVFTKQQTLQKNLQADTKPLVRSLMGYTKTPETIAIKHGRSMELHAKKAYAKIQRQNHTAFKTEESGLMILEKHPYLGASPDLKISCRCRTNCGKGICEIKCPESIKDQSPTSANYKHLVEIDNTSTLSRASPYFTQIQGQMAAAGVEYCDFFVFTSAGSHLERIPFDLDFWLTVEKRLVAFWTQYLAPEILYGTLENGVAPNLIEHSYASPDNKENKAGKQAQMKMSGKGPLKNSKFPKIYLCGKCRLDVVNQPTCQEEESVECSVCHKWYHLRCTKLVDISSATGTDWLCTGCSNKS